MAFSAVIVCDNVKTPAEEFAIYVLWKIKDFFFSVAANMPRYGKIKVDVLLNGSISKNSPAFALKNASFNS